MASYESQPHLTGREKIVRLLLFLVATAVIVYFLPHEGKFRYHFQEGKPWRYGLLTAAFDFPVYKTDAQIVFERDSILKEYHPYYRLNTDIEAKELKEFNLNYENNLKKELTAFDYNYLVNKLKSIYEEGIIESNDLQSLQQDKIAFIRIIDQNHSKLRPLTTLKTVRQAYTEIVNNAPTEMARKSIKSSNINDYLEPNLAYDTLVSEKVRNELLQSISTSSGLVQAGERIVDRGEIITPATFNILRSLEIVNQKRAGTVKQQSMTLLGQVFLTLLFLGALMGFFYIYRPQMFHRLRDLELVFLMVTGMIILCSVLSQFRLISIYLVPFAMVPIVICTFLDSRIAFFTHIITISLCAFLAPFSFEFFLLQTSIGIVTIFSLKEMTERSQLVKTALFILLTYSAVYVIYTLIIEGSWEKVNPYMFAYFGVNSVFLLFTYVLIFILEKTLGFTSTVTLVELSNINVPLLRRLSEECPGTFQHSLQISNLCAQAARRIGANVQLVRTAALYHDIGKLNNPSFFTENQLDVNPHKQISIEQSVGIIKQHVSDGLKLAQREKLPQKICDFIATHHGNGKIKYFYNLWKNDFPDKKLDERIFYYPGPNPWTKEQALLMMADCVEAASRSLKKYDDETLSNLVNNLIDTQMSEGMFKNTPLSFRDVETIKEVFIERLKTMYHARISYPELKKEVSTETSATDSTDSETSTKN